MGASGYLAFENDDALDFLAQLENAEDVSILANTFDLVLDAGESYIELPEAAAAIAAAEVVAALLGRGAVLPETVMTWIERQSKVSLTVVEKARSAANQVLNDSELQELWEESDNYSNWKMAVESLLIRLEDSSGSRTP